MNLFPLMNTLMRLQASVHDKYSNVIFQGNLLDRLPNWLDRLFEGTTHRYYINYWPDFAPK
jgi:DnaJ family protein C protein 16